MICLLNANVVQKSNSLRPPCFSFLSFLVGVCSVFTGGVTMASGSESAAESAAAKWEVGPTEDVVQALMETLVDPRLPLRVSLNEPPSKDAQNSVARQMHAVVLLYNYYHRKQKPELEFLDFVSFCKLALLLRPSLISFMKMTNESESMELNGAEDRLSVTEKAIKDACDIAVALDASKDVPTTEGCPISKVAVLLIDSKKENCLLQFGAVTEGVWSLIEKELNESNINQEILAEEKVGKKRKRSSQKASDDSKFLQLGCDAVKDITGIDSSDLVVLESHVVYSLSKEKSAAQFYMMQCPQSFSINQRVPLKFLVESLRGPLAEKYYDSWTTTTLVEYHQMLPYLGFIPCWLSTKDLCLPSSNGYNARSTMNRGEKELTRSRISALPLSEYSGKDLDHIDNNSSEMEVSSSDNIANENSEVNQKKCKHSSGGKVASSLNISQSTAKDGDATDEFNKRYDTLDSAKKDASRITLENLDYIDKRETGSLSSPSRGLSQKIAKDDNAMEKLSNKCDIVDSAKKEGSKVNLESLDADSNNHRKGLLTTGLSQNTATDENVSEKFNKRCGMADSVKKESRIDSEILDNDNYEYLTGLSSGPSRGLQRMSMSDFAKTCPKSEDTNKKLNSKIRVYHHRRKNISSAQHDAHGQEDDVNLKVEMADLLKSNDTLCKDGKVTADNGDMTISCNQSRIAVTENPLLQFEALHNIEGENVLDSEDLQNALALLYRKRQELCSQMCTMEDDLALYEDNIERIRDGGEVGLARLCIKSILSGNNHLLLKNEAKIRDKGHQPGEDHCNPQSEKQTRLSDTFLPGRSSCKDLEYICLKNNWRLPRYFIEPSDGKFLSNVAVESNNFKLSSEGGLESSPCEARESAAAQMIAKIRNACVSNCDQS
ncbi:hypothetical protein Pfo_001101 [Paulownia fortunei]|nr:hypothetical protein Pfo_001101 [Paulownia fortunei]